VAANLLRLPDDAAVLRALRMPREAGLAQGDAVAVAADVAGLDLAPGATAARAEVVRVAASRIELRAAGPGLLVVAEGWDPGWSATRNDAPARLVRVNHAQLGMALPPGMHRVALRHEPRGFRAGLALCAAAAAGLVMAGLRARGRG
jgi:hypothetical protein